jgi:hypothetical protein
MDGRGLDGSVLDASMLGIVLDKVGDLSARESEWVGGGWLSSKTALVNEKQSAIKKEAVRFMGPVTSLVKVL